MKVPNRTQMRSSICQCRMVNCYPWVSVAGQPEILVVGLLDRFKAVNLGPQAGPMQRQRADQNETPKKHPIVVSYLSMAVNHGSWQSLYRDSSLARLKTHRDPRCPQDMQPLLVMEVLDHFRVVKLRPPAGPMLRQRADQNENPRKHPIVVDHISSCRAPVLARPIQRQLVDEDGHP